jgi:repressor LexA
MEPTFLHGDLVLIRQQPEVQNGQIAAVGVDGEAMLKRVYRQENGITCVSDNPAYPPAFFAAGEGVIVYGLAVGYVRIW